MRPGAVITVAPLSPCASGSNAQNNHYPDRDDWGWAIGADLLAIGLGVGIYEATKSNGTTQPASP